MNNLKIFSIVALAGFMAFGCDDQKMEWEEMDANKKINISEIPLQLAEKIAMYDVLKSYTDLNLGIGVDLTAYLENETYRDIVNANFDEVIIGYHMKHGPMVSSSGAINFTSVDEFIAMAKSAGLTTYGHTLVWHQNQNASYLNGLIAPEVIAGPAGTNLLDLSGLKDGTFTAWNRANPGDGIEVAAGEGLTASASAVKLTSGASSANAWSLQLSTPSIPVVEGHTYEVSFFIKSDKPGKGRISFSGLENIYPWKDWMNTGSGTEAFETTSTWQQVKFTVDDFTGATFNMSFDLGYLPGVTYYMDIDNIIVVDLDGEPAEVNLVSNGDFKTGDLTNWNIANAGAGIEISNTESFTGGSSVKMVASETSSSAWNLQLRSNAISATQGKDYILTFFVKADQAGRGRVSFPGLSNEYPYNDWPSTGGDWTEYFDVTTSWQMFTAKLSNLTFKEGENSFKLSFDFGYLKNVTYYLDDIKVVEVVANAPAQASVLKSATIIHKTDEEKAEIIGEAMDTWIKAMMERYKNDVKAWDVVNEPMLENGTLRDGNVAEPANDEFYWQKYLGKDYAVTAFKLAAQYGNANDILFINDYNLEHSLAKCDGIIEYTKYIESQGARVDGIGTQMHISIDSNKENIVSMFEKLAASGKLIKVTELDIKVNTDSPSLDHYTRQAEMYKFVVDKYLQIIPPVQQYGIAVWGVSDHPDEHVYWIPDDAPNLWDANYTRKIAYKYFADALAGKDISEDFTGIVY
jgi:endo-1,4-beta-xylanase